MINYIRTRTKASYVCVTRAEKRDNVTNGSAEKKRDVVTRSPPNRVCASGITGL